MQQSICMVCHENRAKNRKLKLDKAMQLITISKVKPSTRRELFIWGSDIKCRYGLPCEKLNRENNECKAMYKLLEPYLVAVAESDNESLYQTILQFMRGDFASVYNKMELLHVRYKKRNVFEND